MPIYIITICLQVACAVHCIKTQRNFMWLWLILLFPLVGVLVYLIVEVVPEVQGEASRLPKKKIPRNPEKHIQMLKEQIEFSDSIENRVNLAEAYMSLKKYPEAIEVYKECLKGMYSDDFYLLLGLAYAYFKQKDYEQTIMTLEQIEAQDTTEKLRERKLLEAQSYEHLSKYDQALSLYQSIINSVGEEARCRCALLLWKMERKEEAAKLFKEIQVNAKHSDAKYRKEQKTWIDASRKMLDQINKS